jgi:hypothetical protein
MHRMILSSILGLVVAGVGCGDDSDPITAPTSGVDTGARDTSTGGDGSSTQPDTGSACDEPCSESSPCFPRVASCQCVGGAMMEFDNCVEGCCSELDLPEKCEIACDG